MKKTIWEPIYNFKMKHGGADKREPYQIIGVLYQLRMLRVRLKDYKLRHLKLGKVVYDGRPFETSAFKIGGISWDISWMTDLYLATIIRDYLRFHIVNSPAIGNCILKDNSEGILYEDFLLKDVDNGVDYFQRWSDKVNEVADEFDELIDLIKTNSSGRPGPGFDMLQTKTEEAFKDLAYIFNDLSW